jgi:hypothetical protein
MKRLSILIALAIAAPVAVPRAAEAANCESFTDAPIVYLQVGDTQTNLLKRLGRKLRDNKDADNTPHPIRLVFITNPSCTNINAIYTPVAITATTVMQYLPSLAEDPAWNADDPLHSATLTCTLGAARVPDVANSALFNSACPAPPTPPVAVRAVQGPTQAYVLAVPTAAEPIAITFEEAYLVFGFGMAGMIAPWTDEAQYFIRKLTTSTLLAWAANLGINPASKFKGFQEPGSPDVAAAVIGGTPASIGLLGAEVYDASRTTMKALAYRAKGQYAAYYPDSSSSSRDKKNVRDGHYTVWSPTVWMDLENPVGTPVSLDARYVINLITGGTIDKDPNFDMLKDAIGPVGLVPTCAMQVNRDHEGGELSLFTPTTSCTCKYESVVATTTCATCDATHACATGTTCRAGFCEDH